MSSKGTGRGLGRRRFAVEQLEQRAMLAGNVTATLNGAKSLVVTGDKYDNQVAIVQLDPDSFAVVGLPGTTITGGTPYSGGSYKVVHGVKGNVEVNLKAGNDLLGIGNSVNSLLSKANSLGSFSSSFYSFASSLASVLPTSGVFAVPKNLIVKTEAGNDGVAIDSANVKYNAIIDLGDGNNGLIIDPTYIGDDLIINGGNGIDNVLLQDTYIKDVLSVNLKDGAENALRIEDTCDEGPSYIGGSAVVRAGKGQDYVTIYDTTIQKNLDVNLGDGDNDVYVQDTCDCEEAPMLINGSALIHTGKNSDEVYFYNTHIAKDLIVNTNAGIDYVTFLGGPLDCCDYDDYDTESESVELEPSASVGLSIIINTGANNDYVIVGAEGVGAGSVETSDISYEPVGPVTVGLNVIINTGAGNDIVSVGNGGGGEPPAPLLSQVDEYETHSVLIGLNLSINTAGGKADDDYDTVAVCDTHVGDDLIVVTGESKDRVEIGCDYCEYYEEEVEPSGIEEDDYLDPEEADVYVGDDLTVDLGNGDDNGYADTLLSTLAEDVAGLSLRNTYIKDTAVINLGEGHDTANVENCYIGNDAVVNLLGGDDHLSVRRVFVGDDAVINAGDGNDCVQIRCSEVVDVLSVNMLTGSEDYLKIRDSKARLAVLWADKTTDDDTLDQSGNTFDTFDIFGFDNL